MMFKTFGPLGLIFLLGGLQLSFAQDCRRNPILYPACCNETAPATFNVTFMTTVQGGSNFTLHIIRKTSPYGVDRFYNLVKYHYFDNSTIPGNAAGFFRVVPNFVVQFGIAGSVPVSNAWMNSIIPDDPVVLSNIRGTIAYAAVEDNNGMAVNRTTQVYINYADNSVLDSSGFTPFGYVLGDGMKIVDAIYSGYGQNPDQDSIYNEGDSYLQKNFPKLDYIVGTIVDE